VGGIVDLAAMAEMKAGVCRFEDARTCDILRNFIDYFKILSFLSAVASSCRSPFMGLGVCGFLANLITHSFP
jgi:hypothetical protein